MLEVLISSVKVNHFPTDHFVKTRNFMIIQLKFSIKNRSQEF